MQTQVKTIFKDSENCFHQRCLVTIEKQFLLGYMLRTNRKLLNIFLYLIT